MASGKDISSSEVEALLNEFEQKMKRLRTLYEQYFIGVERTPPTTARKAVVRLMRRLENTPFRNTALKFRLRSLVQRFNSYKSYWNRVERQIEEGTYHRDVKRAKRRAGQDQRRQQGEGEELDMEEIVELDMEEIEELTDLQQELEEMDARGEFEKYVPTEKVSDREIKQRREKAQTADEAEKERIKRERLRELQQQLGISEDGDGQPGGARPSEGKPDGGQSSDGRSSGAPRGGRRSKLQDIKRRFEERTGKRVGPSQDGDKGSRKPSSGIRGAGTKQIRELSAMKEKLEREKRERQKKQQRTIQRNSSESGNNPRPRQTKSGSQRVVNRDSKAGSGRSGGGGSKDPKKVYDKLLEAKRRCNESTQGLTYESVSRSMEKQKSQLRKKRGARDVEFKVVIKDGRAFLKPETK